MGKTVFSTNGVKRLEYPHTKELKSDPYVIPYTKINSTWIEGKTIKLLEESI